MDGLFLENGPYRVNKNLSLSINPGGWQNYATNVYGLLKFDSPRIEIKLTF